MPRVPLGYLFGFFLLLASGAGNLRAASSSVGGTVHDATGAPIAGAQVVLTQRDSKLRTQSDTQGRFVFAGANGDSGTLTVTAPGFGRVDFAWHAEERHDGLDITLPVSRVEERVTVNAAGEAPQPNVATLDREKLETSGAMTVEGALREVPGFKLFRRTPGWSTNGTTGGVSLRGVGANAASRALVLEDGIPATDPYGAWVYWGQFVGAAIDRIEVVQGSESDLYGSEAMGGVINVIRKNPLETRFTADTTFGSSNTPIGSAMGAVRMGKWNVTASGEGFNTNGYLPLAASERGTVDTVVNSEHRTGDLLLEHIFGSNAGGNARAFLGGNYYQEARQNGTLLQVNSADLRQLRTGIDFTSRKLGSFGVRLFGGTESLWQTFSSVSADRNSELLTRFQTVPVSHVGSSVLWSRTAGSRQVLLAGMDTRWVSGNDLELAYTAGTPTANLNNGGSQRTIGFYGEDRLRLTSKLLLSIGGRADNWANQNGHQITTPIVSSVKAASTLFPDRNESAFNPRAAVRYSITGAVTAFASVGRSFRAPSLDELYRSFRVGNVVTNANPNLVAERLTGGEAGLSTRIGNRLVLRGSYFYDIITDPVSNVTLTSTAALITRQRENLGRTRSEGVDVSAQTRITKTLTLETAYQYAAAVVLGFPANASLVGLAVPQVPRNVSTAQLRYSNPKTLTIAVQARYVGKQFDDDQNQFPLNGFFTADAYLSRRIRRGIDVYGAAENMFDRRYQVARTPIVQLGPPVMARAGLRLTFGGAQ
jgi:outer membrane receptor protein involved in Fe transport